MMMGFGMGFGILGLLLMVLFWGGLIALVIWLVRSIFPVSQQTANTYAVIEPNALEILGERYARGEITREQYEMIKQDLQ
jgi:putative membrane protein